MVQVVAMAVVGVVALHGRGNAQPVDCTCSGIFHVGQRVKAVVNNPDGNPEITVGLGGTVKGGTLASPPLLVEWDGITSGHNGNGFCNCPLGCSATSPLGWFVQCNEVVPMCGDGTVDPGEECDDGNALDGDCCSSTCQFPSGCATAAKSILLLNNDAGDDAKDKLTWKWLKGSAIMLGDLADPTSTDYVLCLRAGAGVASVVIPGGSSWQPAGSTGFKFKDPSGVPSGALKAILKSGAAGKSKAMVKGKGTNLPDTLTGMLPFPVTVQLVNSANNTCFQSVFNSASTNDGTQFKAKAQ